MRMRQLTIAIAAAAVLLISTQAFAQEWIDYTSTQDHFSVNFPSQPAVRTSCTRRGSMPSCRPANIR